MASGTLRALASLPVEWEREGPFHKSVVRLITIGEASAFQVDKLMPIYISSKSLEEVELEPKLLS